jgi:hypothetical protein
MSPQVTYAEEWVRWQRRAIKPLDEETARKRHRSGEVYTALLGDPERPSAFVTLHLKLDAVAVGFLDDGLRDYLDYTFAAQEGSDRHELFLEEAVHRTYDKDDELVYAETFFFRPDAPVVVKKTDRVADVTEMSKVEADLSANWEPVPEFGHYESIARKERDQAPVST